MKQREIWVYQFLKKDWASVFSNIETAVQISMMCSNCSGERSFSKLSLIKNHLRSTMKGDKLSVLSIMNIEAKVLNMIEFDNIVNVFVDKKVRKQCSAEPS